MIVKTFEKMVEKEKNSPFEDRKILVEKMLDVITEYFDKKQYVISMQLALLAKRLKCPIRNLDLMRAKYFVIKDIAGGVKECCREELRFFPDNEEARNLLNLVENVFLSHRLHNVPADFDELYNSITYYTMVGAERLLSLYEHSQKICASGIEGNFVETGVAGGGTSALLAYVIKQNIELNPERKIFCCDSFEGMPPPTKFDIDMVGSDANDTGWGDGTCAAPESSLIEICKKLHADDVIQIVKGYFEDTIIEHKEAMGKIALLHMDGDWYSSTKVVIENLYDQLVSGAYVQIDDYNAWQGCKKAIDEFFVARKLHIKLEKIDEDGVYFYKP